MSAQNESYSENFRSYLQITTPLNPTPQMTVYVQILTQTSVCTQKGNGSVDTHVDIILRINSMKNLIHCIIQWSEYFDVSY